MPKKRDAAVAAGHAASLMKPVAETAVLGSLRSQPQRRWPVLSRRSAEDLERVVNDTYPLECNPFAVIDFDAGVTHPPKTAFMLELASRVYAVLHDNDPETKLTQFNCRLRDARVSLEADQHERAPPSGLDRREDL